MGMPVPAASPNGWPMLSVCTGRMSQTGTLANSACGRDPNVTVVSRPASGAEPKTRTAVESSVPDGTSIRMSPRRGDRTPS